jgi:hypothetical protein
VLRSVPLGEDRQHHKYWWFAGDRSLLYVEEGGRFGDQESSRWRVYSSKDELDQLLDYLTEKVRGSFGKGGRVRSACAGEVIGGVQCLWQGL